MSTRNARVCLVAPEFIGPFPNGGVGTACYWEAATLATAGFDVTVLYTGPTERQTAEHWEQTYAAGPFAYIDLWRWAAGEAPGSAGAIEQPCAEARTAELVSRFLRGRSFDLVLFQEFLGHGFRALQARRSLEEFATTRTAVTLHSCRQWIYEGMQRLPSSRQDLYVDFMERESARLADRIVAPSHHMASWAESRWRIERPAVVPYCYDERLEGSATVVDHEGPFTHLVFFGRLETRKGLHVFCRALANDPAARQGVKKVTLLGKGSTVEGQPSEEFVRNTLGSLQGIDVRIISHLGSIEALEWLEQQRHTLVVAPSIVDNLPYAVIELYARRLPIVTARTGGIPEIVGERNAHLLAEPTPEGLARVLGDIHRHGRLTIDYRDGYGIRAANAAHVEWVRSLLARPPTAEPEAARISDIVFADADASELDERRRRFVEADPGAAHASFFTWRQWRESRRQQPAIFAAADIVPAPGLTARLSRALAVSGETAATSYYAIDAYEGTSTVAPLGASLEAGWAENVFGGPCFAAARDALQVLREMPGDALRFWPAYAAMACAGGTLAVVPECLYTTAPLVDGADVADAVIDLYRNRGASAIDLGWVLKYASARASGAHSSASAPGRALYETLVEIPDVQLEAFAGMTWPAHEDDYIQDLRALRRRLATLAVEWDRTHPRAFVYGAGQHARLVLTLEPELGRHIAGFVDRRPVARFLGKPCIRPEQLTPAVADVVLYSSREFERDMHARIAAVDVQHVLLYNERPAAPPDETSTRLRRRLRHRTAPIEALREMYRPPSWIAGGCSHGDVEFLLEMVTALEPHRVLELGVASGTSSAALLFALDRLPASGTERLLHSCDIQRTCYFDASRPTGAAVDEMYPERRTTWVLDTNSDARRVWQALPEGSVDFCFIDANHCHPWPLLDLLHIAPLLRPESWVALHDIELPRLHPQFQVHGPQWLFQAWPFNKIHGVGDSVNIGAIQLPAHLPALVPLALTLLEREWEHTPTTWHVDLPDVFADITRAVAPRLERPVRARAS